MKVLTEYKGYELIERYNKRYIRFWGGRDENMPCEFPITQEQADKAIDNPNLIDEYIKQQMKILYWTPETFYQIGIVEYIINGLGKSQEYAKKAYEKICEYEDIRDEFYNYIMDEKFSKTSYTIKVEGYTAEELCNTKKVTPLEAYNYLIYLRENPQEALKQLKATLNTDKIIDIECFACNTKFQINCSNIPSNQKTFYWKCPSCNMELKRGNPNYKETDKSANNI